MVARDWCLSVKDWGPLTRGLAPGCWFRDWHPRSGQCFLSNPTLGKAQGLLQVINDYLSHKHHKLNPRKRFRQWPCWLIGISLIFPTSNCLSSFYLGLPGWLTLLRKHWPQEGRTVWKLDIVKPCLSYKGSPGGKKNGKWGFTLLWSPKASPWTHPLSNGMRPYKRIGLPTVTQRGQESRLDSSALWGCFHCTACSCKTEAGNGGCKPLERNRTWNQHLT